MGAAYLAEGWVRTAPGQAAPASVQIVLRNYTIGSYEFLESKGSPEQVIDGAWRRIQTTMKITRSGGTLNVYLEAEHQPGACFLFDDIAVRRLD